MAWTRTARVRRRGEKYDAGMSAHDDLVAALAGRAQALRAAAAGLSLDLSSPGVAALLAERAGVPDGGASAETVIAAGVAAAHDPDVMAALPAAMAAIS